MCETGASGWPESALAGVAGWHVAALCLRLALLAEPRLLTDQGRANTPSVRLTFDSQLFSVLAVALAACSRPKPPTIAPKSATVVAVSPVGVQLAVTFDVTNPNGFPLLARAVDGRFVLGSGSGVELGKAHTVLASSIPAESTSSVTSQLVVSWTSLAALAPFMLSPAPVPYRFDGTASVGGERLNADVPFTVTGELTRAQLIDTGLAGLRLPLPR